MGKTIAKIFRINKKANRVLTSQNLMQKGEF